MARAVMSYFQNKKIVIKPGTIIATLQDDSSSLGLNCSPK